MKRSRVDLVVITLMLMASLFFMFRSDYGDKKLYLINNNTKKEIQLTKQTIKADDGKVIIEVAPDGARFTESTCQNKICIKQGWVKNCGQTAVCVPNHVALVMECKEQDYDAISQ